MPLCYLGGINTDCFKGELPLFPVHLVVKNFLKATRLEVKRFCTALPSTLKISYIVFLIT
jgi:hypothetical protein